MMVLGPVVVVVVYTYRVIFWCILYFAVNGGNGFGAPYWLAYVVVGSLSMSISFEEHLQIPMWNRLVDITCRIMRINTIPQFLIHREQTLNTSD